MPPMKQRILSVIGVGEQVSLPEIRQRVAEQYHCDARNIGGYLKRLFFERQLNRTGVGNSYLYSQGEKYSPALTEERKRA